MTSVNETRSEPSSDRAPSLERLLRERYGGHSPLAPSATPGFVPGLLSHRSVRKYLPRPLAAGTLELLVAAAQSAASSSNLQLWSVISVEDPDRRARLSELANRQAHVRESSAFLVWLADLNRATVLAREQGIEPEALDYLEMFLVASVDAALAAQNAVVAAESLGLGTVYIGGMRNHPREVAEVLGLPPRVFGLFGMCVGWPDESKLPAVKPRLPQSVVLGRDTYASLEPQREHVRAHDAAIREFNRANKPEAGGASWTVPSAKRVANAESLHGRDRLRGVLEGLGFGFR